MSNRLLGMRVDTLLNIMHNFNEQKNLSHNNRLMNLTFSHTHQIFKEMEKFGIITVQKLGRANTIRFTPEGKVIRDIIKTLRVKLIETGAVKV